MDASAFDRLTLLAGGSSRRGALKTALGGATLAAAGVLTSAGAHAKRRRKKCKKKCPTCSGKSLGQVCARTSECCATQTNLACAFTSASNEETVCCGTTGVPCPGGDGDCCFDFDCDDGVCQPD
jgi:hypothetical protein